MLTGKEKDGIIDLLNRLTYEDVLAIAKTTTQNILHPNSREEACQIITTHEDKPRTILNRKKVTRDILVKYLHERKFPFSAKAEKSELIEKVLEFWKTSEVFGNAVEGRLSPVQPSLSPAQSHSAENCIQNYSEWANLLALKFSEWFYKALNGMDNGGRCCLKNEDFWNESIAQVKISTGNAVMEYNASESVEILDIINTVKSEHKLLFWPNLSPAGVKGQLSPHGIVLVTACGTLHRNVGECVGVFEQMFYLIKDPLSNDNWKIKRTLLNLKAQSGVTRPPSLEEGELSKQIVCADI